MGCGASSDTRLQRISAADEVPRAEVESHALSATAPLPQRAKASASNPDLIVAPASSSSLVSTSANPSPALPCQVSARRSFAWTQQSEPLGAGAHGTVYLALNQNEGGLMAMKAVDVPHGAGRQQQLKAIQHEVGMLRSLDHPNIVRYIRAEIVSAQRVCIFTEWVSGGSIKDVLGKFGPLPESAIARYTRDTLRGLAYLHAHNVIHRDIKCANLLVTDSGKVKLADFGSAMQLQPDESLTDETIVGTPYYLAPELLGRGHAGEAIDIWGVGCTIIEMATGKPPWHECGFSSPAQLFRHIASSSSGPQYPDSCSGEMRSFLDLCLHRDPSKRASINVLLNHLFLTDVAPTPTHSIKRALSTCGGEFEDVDRQQLRHSSTAPPGALSRAVKGEDSEEGIWHADWSDGETEDGSLMGANSNPRDGPPDAMQGGALGGFKTRSAFV